MNIADDEDERQDADGGNGTDKDHGTDKRTGKLDDESDDDGRYDTGQITGKAEYTTGQAQRFLGSNVPNGTPNDGGHALAKKG